MEQLFNFLSQNPQIHHVIPSSPDFNNLRSGYVIDSIVPAIIVRPRSADDVAGLVTVLKKNSLAFSVRVGGSDMFNRFHVKDTVTIDLREIAHINVDQESQTARLGGGVIISDLLRVLDEHGMVAPHPIISSVGYVGWATHGGYGLLSSEYGMGAEQILQAKIVDADGAVRDADEDMLTVIRGGGGALGVIVELTIRVYSLTQLLAGFIVYDSQDLPMTIRRYNDAYRQQKEAGIPKELNLFQSVTHGPTGKAMGVIFVWASSDFDAGQKWLSKVSSWSPVAMSTVAPTTMSVFNESTKTIAPQSAYGKSLTLSLRELTPEVVEVICKHASLQPNSPATIFGMHELRGCAPQPPLNTLIAHRHPHFVMELLPTVRDADLLDAAVAWAHEFYEDLMKTDPANIMASTYLPLTEPGKVNMKGIFGDKYEFLKVMKHRHDPENVFEHALVRL
ncbi:unnamed protein product [Penicillium salamii]|nr:unnamed protein product [Penicillium salamii]